MSKQFSVIEINGKRYDAISGKLIGTVKKIAQPAASGSIDGFTRAKNRLVSTVKPRAKQPATTVHKRPQKGKTLMRRSVKQPQPPKNFHKILSGASLGSITPARLTRAAGTHKSAKIIKYSGPAPLAQKSQKIPYNAQIITQPAGSQSQAVIAIGKPLPSMVTSVSHQKLEKMLDEALAKADAHKQMLKQLQKRNFWSRAGLMPKWLGAGLVVVLAISAVGLFAWQRIPQVSLKLAAGKAKISASVPNYKPEGFSVQGPVKYQSGAVVMNYGTGTSQKYILTQKASDWDSASLAANTIPSSSPVQTSQVKGTTVYIYGTGNDATWVSNGIRYTLKDKANLSSDEILKIANSL